MEHVIEDNRKRLSALETNNSSYDDDEDSDDGANELEQTTLENFYCLICRIDFSNVLFLPCRHAVTCLNCYQEIQRAENLCPKCERGIEKIIEIVQIKFFQ